METYVLSTSLTDQPWKNIIDKRNNALLVKGNFSIQHQTGYVLLVYDQNALWYEQLDKKEFESTCQIQNPNVEADGKFVLSQLENLLTHYKSDDISFQVSKDTAVLYCCTKLKEDIPFVWNFHLKQAPAKWIHNLLVAPLLVIANGYYQQQQLLFSLLEKKDAEIADLKSQGVNVTRSSLETATFNRSAFDAKCLEEICKEQEQFNLYRFFKNNDNIELFQKAINAAAESKISPDASTTITEEPTLLITQEQEPTVLLPDSVSTDHVAAAAGEKRKHDGSSEVIDMELKRRAELQERLAKKAELKAKSKASKFKL